MSYASPLVFWGGVTDSPIVALGHKVGYLQITPRITCRILHVWWNPIEGMLDDLRCRFSARLPGRRLDPGTVPPRSGAASPSTVDNRGTA